MLPITGNQLKLSFGINAPESRAIFTDTKLPDNSPVGVKLDGYVDYANLVYKGTTTGGTQSWALTEGSVTLTDTKGTIYAYWPYSSTTSIDAIDVDMTAADQTDWLYATPVTDVNEDKASVAVTMNHALANINVTVNKGSYLGVGNITNITVQSDGIALGGTFNAAQATPGYTAFENEGKPLSRTVTTTTGAAATDIMVVPTGTSAAVTFLLTIDGIQFTATSAAVQLAMGNSYQYTLNLSDISTYMEISGFSVKPWNSTTGGTLDLEEYDPFIKYADWIQAIIYIDETEVTSRSTGVEVPILSTSSSFDINSIQMIAVDGVQIEPSINYTFNTPGRHVIHYLPVDVSCIPQYLFYNLTTLVEVKIPQTVISIGSCAFHNCTALTEVTIPNSVTAILNSAFGNCTGLTEVTIPESVTSIGGSAFNGCSGLTNVTIPGSVTSIGMYAFQNCTGLKEVDIKEGVQTIELYMFYGCTGLTELNIPNSVQTIKQYAFKGCSGLTGELVIPNSVISIEGNAFSDCSGLTGELVIPNSVTSIGNATFSGCTGFTKVKISESMQNIASNAFSRCTGLTGTLTIPNSVTSIGDKAFYGCTGLTGELVIPNSVETIGKNAFYGCSGITSINICYGVKKIEQSAFSGCTGIVEIVIPESVTSLGNTVFPRTLNKITSLATTAPSITSDTFYDVKSQGTLIVPSGCTDAYSSWMRTGNYYLGKYNWTIQEMTE